MTKTDVEEHEEAETEIKENTNTNSGSIGPKDTVQDVRKAEISYLQSAILYQLVLDVSAKRTNDTQALCYPTTRARVAAAEACQNLPLRNAELGFGKDKVDKGSTERPLFNSDCCYGLEEDDVLGCVSEIQPEELHRFREEVGKRITGLASRINGVYDELYSQGEGVKNSLEECLRGIDKLVMSTDDRSSDTWTKKQQAVSEYCAVLDQLTRSQLRRVKDQKLGVASELIRESVARSREQNLALQGKIRRETFKVLRDIYTLEVCDELDKYKMELDGDIAQAQSTLKQAQDRLSKFLDDKNREEFDRIAEEYNRVMDELEEETNLNEKLKLDVGPEEVLD